MSKQENRSPPEMRTIKENAKQAARRLIAYGENPAEEAPPSRLETWTRHMLFHTTTGPKKKTVRAARLIAEKHGIEWTLDRLDEAHQWTEDYDGLSIPIDLARKSLFRARAVKYAAMQHTPQSFCEAMAKAGSDDSLRAFGPFLQGLYLEISSLRKLSPSDAAKKAMADFERAYEQTGLQWRGREVAARLMPKATLVAHGTTLHPYAKTQTPAQKPQRA